MKSILPIILVILLLTGAITYVLSKNTLPKEVTKQETISPNELEVDSFMTPTPTESIRSLGEGRPTPTATPTPALNAQSTTNNKQSSTVPTVTLKDQEEVGPTTKGGLKEQDIKIVDADSKSTVTRVTLTRTQVCTPVYGAADTCVEHEVVDTAGETVLFFNLAGLSYLAGLGAFIKSKYA